MSASGPSGPVVFFLKPSFMALMLTEGVNSLKFMSSTPLEKCDNLLLYR